MSRWTETKGRKPRTGDALLKLKFRSGIESEYSYRADQIRWTDTGHPFDVVAVRRTGERAQ